MVDAEAHAQKAMSDELMKGMHSQVVAWCEEGLNPVVAVATVMLMAEHLHDRLPRDLQAKCLEAVIMQKARTLSAGTA